MSLEVIILAAGKGKRMCSQIPKVLNKLAGRTLLEHVVATAHKITAQRIHIVYGHGGDTIRNSLPQNHVNWVEQTELLGTAHAVMQALPHVADDAKVLVLYGDVPLLSVGTLDNLITATSQNGVGILTAIFNDPTGYGRILRDEQGQLLGIVEHKDATANQLAINEINTGILCAPAQQLKQWLHKVKCDNAQGEYYLTDIIAMAVAQQAPVISVQPNCHEEVLGINDRQQLAALERYYQLQQARYLMRQGAIVVDPARIDVRGEISIKQDIFIDINNIFAGNVTIGANTHIGPNCFLRDVVIGDNVEIKANSIIEEAQVASDCTIGPFARIRPGSQLAQGVHVGNFVELKKAQVDAFAKINHLSYMGDCHIGEHVNVGAGTITCNYDGVNKHFTEIGAGCFIGSGTQLVAPVTIGAQAYIGAGSTITQEAPANQLTLARARQMTLTDWVSPKQRQEESK